MRSHRAVYRLTLLSLVTSSATFVAGVFLAPNFAILCGSVANISCLLVLAFLLGDGMESLAE